jgi:predicted SAM-dependent methyltransferase
MNEIPVILVCYNRPVHTSKVLNALKEHNIQNLYIYSDAPKSERDTEAVLQTREVIKSIDWTKPKAVYQSQNIGLAKSITSSVNDVFKEFDRLILLEDDCVPQKYFFDFMYNCLNKYEDNKQIFGVTGYTVPVPQDVLSRYPYDLYFFPRIGSWGWGTWKSKWDYKVDDLSFLKNEIERKGIDINIAGNDVPVMLEKLLNGTLNDVWTMNWLLSVYLNDGFYIYPTVSHIVNIGLDGTGVHCGKTNQFDTVTAESKPYRYPDKLTFDERITENFYLKHNLPNSSNKNFTISTDKKECTRSALEIYNSIKHNAGKQISGKAALERPRLKMLNLGCGSRYHKDWINIDFKGNNNGVIAYNLTDKLSFNENEIDVVYHSHLLEHFTKEFAPEFLKECYRVLKPGGIIRVVVPDLEQIARQYINLLEGSIKGDKDSQDKYDWIMLEMFDQTVRNYSGGEMLKYWQQDKIPAEEFVIERMGSEAKNAIDTIKKKASFRKNETKVPTPLEIGQFRLSGEVHQWMYDRYSLGKILKHAGFNNIKVCNAYESGIPEFGRYLLDIEPDNSIRKPDSLFMEAMK